MKTRSLTKTQLIAPCGMNCGVCYAYLRQKNKCPGCRTSDSGKPVSILRCKIRSCSKLASRFCFSCKEFPCAAVKHLDKRYRTKYNMSMIENLNSIIRSGVRSFVRTGIQKWMCPKCGGVVCVHNKKCYACLSVKGISD